MKLFKITLTIATILSVFISTETLAVNLYMDTKTRQIYADPGVGRVLMGSFIRENDIANNLTEIKSLSNLDSNSKENFVTVNGVPTTKSLSNSIPTCQSFTFNLRND